ncbi:hypothetical protein B0H11DRAFT_1981622 [Mycena galericulata]|nr:hypothetical protein B0H11DRAFT_1981622 [Mycena galericulata]
MKIILAGATGFIGTEVLAQCLRNPVITSIVVLSRRPLPGIISAHPDKVHVIVMKDFKAYSTEAVKQLEGADACIWAFARAFAPTLAGQEKPFRYMHTSGVLAERDQSKSLLFLQEGRRIKGTAETEMIAFAKQEVNQGHWETFIVKPAMVLHKEGDVLKRLGGVLLGTVQVDQLAAVMIDVVSNGNKEQTLRNPEIVEKGKALLKTH